MSGIKLFQLARTFLIRNRPFYAAIVSDCVINLNWKKTQLIQLSLMEELICLLILTTWKLIK